MSLLRRKRPNNLDELQVAQRLASERAGSSPGATPLWRGDEDQRAALLRAALLYAQLELPVRVEEVGAPDHAVDGPQTVSSFPHGAVTLTTLAGEPRAVPVEALLDANPLLAQAAGVRPPWCARPPHTWTPWQTVLGWVYEPDDPHGGLFDLPDAYRDEVHSTLPLFGWRVDLLRGARRTEHGVGVVRMTHPAWEGHRTVPLFDAARAFKRGQTAHERARSRSVRLPEGHGHLVALRVADGEVDAALGGDAQHPVTVPLDALLALNPDLAPFLDDLRDHELVELRRRLEAHLAAGGSWVLEASVRAATGRATLPLTGWRLAQDAFVGLTQGLVRLAHPSDPHPVAISAAAASRGMSAHVDARLRLYGDPCVAPTGAARGAHDGRMFVRGILPQGFALAPAAGEGVPADAVVVPHGRFLRDNPGLIDAVFDLHPDLGAWSDDDTLRRSLATLADQPNAPAWVLAHLDALTAPAPMMQSPLAKALAAEPLERMLEDIPLRSEDGGALAVWIGVSAEGRFRLAHDATPAGHLLPGPAATGELPAPDAGALQVVRDYTAEQLAWAHPQLARRIAAWQRAAGLLDDDGLALSLGDRLGRLVEGAVTALTDAHSRTRQHIRVSRELREDPRRARTLEQHLERLETNLGDLRKGHTVRAWVEERHLPHVGVAIAPGGAGGGGNRAMDDRIRLTDFVETRYLGPLRLVMVAGGDSLYTAPSGPLITRLLDDAEDRVTRALRDAVDLDEAASRARDAILAASAAAGRTSPFCSLVAALVHKESGQVLLLWSGNAGAWRLKRARGELDRLTWDHSAEGLVGLCVAAGLRPPDAVSLLLQLALRKVDRRELETLPEAQLVGVGERFTQPGRRRALRAALGGPQGALGEEHDRLLALLRTYRDAYDHFVDVSPVQDGAAMVFVRRVRVRPGDRLILASDGLTTLLERHALLTLRSLRREEPQRAAEWLAELVAQDPASDDLAVVLLDLPPSTPFEPAFTRRLGQVHRRTADQSQLGDGGVVPAPGDHALPPLRLRARMLARFEAEVDDLVRKRRLPDPGADPAGFVEGLARWAIHREGERPPSRRPGEELRDLHEVLDERDDDPSDETLITLHVLRRRGFDARYVAGVRAHGRGAHARLVQTCWLDVRVQGRWRLLDLGLGPRLRDRHGPAEPNAARAASGVRALFGARPPAEEDVTWVPWRTTWVEVPVDDATFEEEVWMRAAPDAPTPAAAPPSTAAASAPAAPPSGPPPPPSSGWLDLE